MGDFEPLKLPQAQTAQPTPRAAGNATLDYMQSIAHSNTDPGRIVALVSNTGNPHDAKLSAGKPVVAYVNGNGAVDGPEITGIPGNGVDRLGSISVVFSATDLTPNREKVSFSELTLRNRGVKYAPLNYVSENQINFNVPELPPGLRMLDANVGSGFIHVVRREANGTYSVYPGIERQMSIVPQYDLFPLTSGAIREPEATNDPINDQRPFANRAMRNVPVLNAKHADGKLVLPSDPAGPGESITFYATGLPNSSDQIRIRMWAGPDHPTNKSTVSVFPSEVKETAAGSGFYAITFQIPDQAALTTGRLLLPDGRGVPGSETHDELFLRRAAANWYTERPDGRSPTPGSGLFLAIDRIPTGTTTATAATITTSSRSDGFYLPAGTAQAR